MQLNLGNLMQNRAFLSPDQEAGVGGGYRYSYEQINKRANQVAELLAAKRIRPGDRVAVLGKNDEWVTTCLFGAAKIGVVTVLLNWRLHARELAFILNDCTAAALIYDQQFAEPVEQIRTDVGCRVYICRNSGSADPDFEAELQKMPGNEPQKTGTGSDPALLMYTSGTTGKPKGVTLSHDNLFWASIGLSHTIDWRSKSRFLSVAPLFHIGGLAPILANVHRGCTTVYMPDFDPQKIWSVIADEKINFLMTVPLMLQYMIMMPGMAEADLSHLNQIICGGSPVAQSLIAAYREKGINVHQVYGATEYTGAITFWTHDMPWEKADSAGKPVFHGDVKILSPDNGRELGPDEVGEICLFGPQVFTGYWNNPAATKEVLIDGYYRSGDLGKKDAEGFVCVVDRLKDMIISGGENIYPAEIEALLVTQPGVAEAAVVGRADEKWGEAPVAFIAPQKEARVSKADILELCRQNLAGFKQVKDVVFVEAIPKNSVGKVLKKDLQTMMP